MEWKLYGHMKSIDSKALSHLYGIVHMSTIKYVFACTQPQHNDFTFDNISKESCIALYEIHVPISYFHSPCVCVFYGVKRRMEKKEKKRKKRSDREKLKVMKWEKSSILPFLMGIEIPQKKKQKPDSIIVNVLNRSLWLNIY